ncbi:hypothetical protein HQQ81_04040 [Microbacteriaceae bacterium VKM Ac-2854]|nr:hypothetical protein [Microbacteriaceae bacterium VKM Ac-2854]
MLASVVAAPAVAASNEPDPGPMQVEGSASSPTPADTRGLVRVTATPPVVPAGTVFPDIRIALTLMVSGETVETDTASVWIVLADGFTWEDGTALTDPRLIAPGPDGVARGELHLVPGQYGVRSPRLGSTRTGTIRASATDSTAPADRPTTYEQSV